MYQYILKEYWKIERKYIAKKYIEIFNDLFKTQIEKWIRINLLLPSF